MPKLIDDNQTYAKLLASIQTSGKRPLSPLETAGLIERLVNEEGRETAGLLLPIEKDMITYFLRLKNGLPKECQNAVLWGTTNSLGVGFTSAHLIATLNDDDDKRQLFSLCFQKKISKEDIKKIISEFKRTKQPFEKVIEKIYGSIRKITTYMIVLAISENTVKRLEEKSKAENKNTEEIFVNSLKEKFGLEDAKDFKIQGVNLAFSLSESNYKKYSSKLPELDIIFDDITNYIVG